MGKVTKATVSNTSISKAKTATYSALPKTADSNWTAASTVLRLLRIAILGAVHLVDRQESVGVDAHPIR